MFVFKKVHALLNNRILGAGRWVIVSPTLCGNSICGAFKMFGVMYVLTMTTHVTLTIMCP